MSRYGTIRVSEDTHRRINMLINEWTTEAIRTKVGGRRFSADDVIVYLFALYDNTQKENQE